MSNMKTKFRRLCIAPALLAFSILNSQLATVFAQGSLTPPGAPAPTMLTLNQIEPRTPVDAAHTGSGGSSEFLITQPGSYYLTTNVVGVSGENGINISANNVTLDLNGFSVQGISGVWSGVYIHAGYANVTVRNGNISGWGTSSPYSGVECYANNVILERLKVSANHYGIYLDSSGVVRDCNCYNNTGIGIQVNAGKVSGCEALNNGSTGIYVITGTVSDCDALNNASYGIDVGTNCTVKDCTSDNNYEGIYVSGNGSQITGNTCSSNSDSGIYISSAKNRIDNNTVGYNGSYGILEISSSAGNSITRNFAPGDFVNYYNPSGNTDFAPIQTNSTATSPWANF
jgi:parallel beta-helix repeat protein